MLVYHWEHGKQRASTESILMDVPPICILTNFNTQAFVAFFPLRNPLCTFTDFLKSRVHPSAPGRASVHCKDTCPVSQRHSWYFTVIKCSVIQFCSDFCFVLFCLYFKWVTGSKISLTEEINTPNTCRRSVL